MDSLVIVKIHYSKSALYISGRVPFLCSVCVGSSECASSLIGIVSWCAGDGQWLQLWWGPVGGLCPKCALRGLMQLHHHSSGPVGALPVNVRVKYILHLKLLLKAWALSVWILIFQISNDCPKFMGNYSSASTAQVVIEGIMDEGILILWNHWWQNCIILILMVMPRKIITGIYALVWENF